MLTLDGLAEAENCRIDPRDAGAGVVNYLAWNCQGTTGDNGGSCHFYDNAGICEFLSIASDSTYANLATQLGSKSRLPETIPINKNIFLESTSRGCACLEYIIHYA